MDKKEDFIALRGAAKIAERRRQSVSRIGAGGKGLSPLRLTDALGEMSLAMDECYDLISHNTPLHYDLAVRIFRSSLAEIGRRIEKPKS